MHLPGLRGLNPLVVLRKSVRDFLADDMPTYAAALAYHVFFSLFPFVFFLIALLEFLGLSHYFDVLWAQARFFFPQRSFELVTQLIDELRVPERGLLSFGAVIALWLASGGVRSLIIALNVIYGAKRRRPAWKRYLLSIIYTIGIAVMLIVASALMTVGPAAMQWLAAYAGFKQLFVTLWTWLRWPAALLLLTVAVAISYDAAPNVTQRFRLVSPGSVLSVAAWVAASLAFGYYVRHFASYSVMFGSVGIGIVLLLYFYISCAVLLFGAEVNAVIECASANNGAGDKTPQAERS